MHSHFTRTRRTKIAAGASAAVLSAFALIASVQAADSNTPVDAIKTATPIKHVIIIVGENRSFDHLFATYVPRHEEERILNLLSEGIITAAGAPERRRDSHPPAPRERPPGSGRFTAPDQQVPHEELNNLVTLIQRRAAESRHAAIRTRTGWLDLDDFSLYP
jgi:hypothetical protein